jgi:ribonuclease HII
MLSHSWASIASQKKERGILYGMNEFPVDVCGLDEAGRGPLAGPMVAALVSPTLPLSVLQKKAKSPIRDSKLLSAIQRQKIMSVIEDQRVLFFVETISVEEINTRGIGWANKEIMYRLMKRFFAPQYIVDGNMKLTSPHKNSQVKSIIDADATVPSVILAGIVAKVTRDRIMDTLHTEYPMYGWNHNKGYGTAMHEQAILTFGITHHHRTLFVRNVLAQNGV